MNVGKSMFIEEKNDSTQPLSNLNMVDKGRNQSLFVLFKPTDARILIVTKLPDLLVT